MNFFEHQDRARRQSQRLLILFFLAVTAVVSVFAALTAVLFTPDLMIPVAMGVLLLIVGASWIRITGLRNGGGRVAEALGGTLVPSDTHDPLRRRLLNVVEEMAIAAGVPVPEVYVLEQEHGINAFAAGYSSSDAAVAVTRGLLEHLDRTELQGVIAHEFSHILNGDMRINIRLMGFLFGLLMIAVMGQRMMLSTRYSRNSKDTGAVVAISLVIMVLGYVGLFFGRLIKAAVSRQREYLADAAAVQFTRNPQAVSGALKKIAALSAGSTLQGDTEEVGHMLFGAGYSAWLFATHPPLNQRIRAIEPSFDPAELDYIAKQLDRHREAERARQEMAEQPGEPTSSVGVGALGPALGGMIDQLGAPDFQQLVMAGALLQALPEALLDAAHSDERVEALVLALLLSSDVSRAQQQLLRLREREGGCLADAVEAIDQDHDILSWQSRLLLVELSAPAWRRRPAAELERWLETLDAMVIDAHWDERFTLALERLVRLHVAEALDPGACQHSGRGQLSAAQTEAGQWLSLLCWTGVPERDELTWQSAMKALSDASELACPDPEQSLAQLDHNQLVLNALKPADKQRLIEAMWQTLDQSSDAYSDQYELFRLLSALLHVPVPVHPESLPPPSLQS